MERGTPYGCQSDRTSPPITGLWFKQSGRKLAGFVYHCGLVIRAIAPLSGFILLIQTIAGDRMPGVPEGLGRDLLEDVQRLGLLLLQVRLERLNATCETLGRGVAIRVFRDLVSWDRAFDIFDVNLDMT